MQMSESVGIPALAPGSAGPPTGSLIHLSSENTPGFYLPNRMPYNPSKYLIFSFIFYSFFYIFSNINLIILIVFIYICIHMYIYSWKQNRLIILVFFFSLLLDNNVIAEDQTRKREIRLQKNREAARECRRKKKEYIKCLENRVAVLENQNKALIEELKSLKELYCQTKND